MSKYGEHYKGQHACHIIAASNGGADHTDNFRLMGAELNMGLKDKWDGINVFLVGMEQAKKAVARSVIVGNKDYNYFYEFRTTGLNLLREVEHLFKQGEIFSVIKE
eukprot:216877-Chlamydomonas_euryale.AAC.6